MDTDTDVSDILIAKDGELKFDKEDLINTEIPTYEELLEEQGGFGRYQLFAFLTIMAAINTTGWE